MILILVIITLFYLLLIINFVIGFGKVKKFVPDDTEPINSFSIIIPFRNEAKNLKELLESISSLNYPINLFEVILVNDASDDHSERIINKHCAKNKLNLKIINNIRTTKSPKKDAINLGISLAKFDWIITTDADCVLPKFWLNSFDNFIQSNKPKLIIAPVSFHKITSFLDQFQLLDLLSLQGATIGGFGINKPFLCNGANMAYTKQFFKELKGFEGNFNIASGDDIFLLEKAVKQHPEKVNYLKTNMAIVKTKPEPSLNSLVSQRIRWAAKTSRYNWFGKGIGLLVFMMNISLICCFLFVISDSSYLKYLIYIFTLKFSIDFLLLFKTSRFFNQEIYFTSYIFSSLLYPFFSVFIAISSAFTGYKWKGTYYRK